MHFDTRNNTVNGQRVDVMPRFRVLDKTTGEPIHRVLMADDRSGRFVAEVKTVEGNKKIRQDRAKGGLFIEILGSGEPIPQFAEPQQAEEA